jgi:two-component system, cell cycle response regulator DivK
MSLADWTVIVVEDEEDSLELVHGLLEHYGIHCVGVPTAEQALSVLETTTPHLIIIDLNLPGMDGWELMGRLKGHRTLGRIPRVAITAYHSAEVANQAIEQGFDAYFAKPLDATSFVRELSGIVEG